LIKSILRDDYCLKKRPLFFYGAGSWCRKIIEFCEILDIWPDYIVDRDSRLWGKSIKGVGIISPSEMQMNDPDCPVLITTFFIKSAEQSLKQYGFNNMWHFPKLGDLICCFGLNADAIEKIYRENHSTILHLASNLADQRSVGVFNGNIMRRRANWDDFTDIAEISVLRCLYSSPLFRGYANRVLRHTYG